MLNINNTKIINLMYSKNSRLNQATIILLGSALIAIFTQFTIPLLPVPASLQNFSILLVGAVFGPRIGGGIVLLYLLEGLCGMPVFTKYGCGLVHLLGPTGGYLIGYPIAAYLTGYLFQSGWLRNYFLIFVAFLLGDIVLFASGYLWLTHLIGCEKAYLFGVAQFYLAELFKLLLLTVTIALFLRKTDTSLG